MEEDFVKEEAASYSFKSSSDTLLSIQLLEFKASLFEAIEELQIGREANIQYEEQISKIVVEKQELEWQNESLAQQSETLMKQHNESIAAFKKQLQAKICTMEEEKGQFQLAAETKEKEITGLKEDLKALQISKYTLQKKLGELEQKVQLNMIAKEDNLKQLSEVEKCYATITRQFGMVKSVHEKLEQNVHEAVQRNQKLKTVNKQRENEIDQLKQELEKVTAELIRSKVTHQKRVGEESINLIEKEQQLQELQQILQTEREINKKLNEEHLKMYKEKQEIICSLQNVQELLKRQTETIAKMETQFISLQTDYEILGKDNELHREKAKENEEKFLHLQNEHEKALGTWKKDKENFKEGIASIRSKLISIKEAYDHLQECHSMLSSQRLKDVDQVKQLQDTVQQHSVNGIESNQIENGCTSAKRENGIIYGEETEGQRFEDLDLQVLENGSMDKINTSRFCQELQEEETAQTQTLQTVTLTNTGDQTLHVSADKHSEIANDELTEKVCLEKNYSGVELKSHCSPYLLSTFPVGVGKMPQDSTESLGVCTADTGQQTDPRKHTFDNAAREELYNINDNIDTTQYDIRDFITEPPNKEYQPTPGTEETPINKDISHNSDAEAESDSVILFHPSKIYLAESQKCSKACLDEKQNKQGKTEQVNLLNETDMSLSSEEVCNNDTASRTNEHCAFNASNTVCTDAIQSSPSCCVLRVNVDTDIEKEMNCADTMCEALPTEILSNNDIYIQESALMTNMNEVLNGRTDQESSQDKENEPITNVHAADFKHVYEENMSTSQNIGSKSANADLEVTKKTNIDLTALSEKGHDANDCQLYKQKHESFAEKDNVVEDALLNERKYTENSRSNTCSERKCINGLEESSSLRLKPSGNVLNRCERSVFDLRTSDEKTEKTPVYLHFSDLIPLAKVNQVKTQTVSSSTCNMPFFLREKLAFPSKSKKMCSWTFLHNASMDGTETGPDSANMKPIGDTLNTSHIPQGPKRDHSEEWNAIAQTFYDSSFPKENAKTESIAKQISSTVTSACDPDSSAPPVSSRTNDNIHPLSRRTETSQSPETLFDDEADFPPFNIHDQIKEIEMFLSLQRLKRTRKRKSEETQVEGTTEF